MNHKKHICIIVDCLCGGGAEKVAASFSFLLKSKDYKVSIISVRDDITYKYTGDLYNLGTNELYIKKFKQLKKILLFRRYYRKIDADFYVDFRMRNRFLMELLLHLFVFKTKKMVLSIQNYNIEYHIPKGFFFKKVYSKAKAIIAVSHDIVMELNSYYPFNNVSYIPNFVNKNLLLISNLPLSDIPNNTVLAIGRLNIMVKQFDKLILSYKNTDSCKKGIPLVILGDGPDKKKLEDLIKFNKLQSSVKLLGFVSNPYDYIKRCKFLVLCSKFEGMPLVILETLTLGKPVISFNCKSGPAELITHKKNGLLVKDQDFSELERSIDLLQEDEELYDLLTKNTISSMNKFSEKEMMKYWESVFNF
ncbi:glycosyltransferase [Flavivirga algicola]|uniref:Glycosyltransferase family 4 protein n=1 Tax=Flavivirga algicola TaxID=2729136 RepID=A0ABX1RWS0_9FLAO|nr:glycosyltransferase [Flavivirga algicola]NMH88016.1 glycosyltransferase family 4 protein [Flavivirga algicola]